MTKTAEAPKSDFSALLSEMATHSDEIAVLAKAMDKEPDADSTIEAAAAEATEGEAKPGTGKTADGEVEDDEKPMGKALKVIDADGGESDAIDATDLLKSLVNRVEAIGAGSVEANTALLGVVKAQGALIKSMSDKIEKLGGQGSGRRTVLTVHDKGATAADALAKSLGGEAEAPAGVDGKDFLAKALAAANAGRISHREANFCETLINKGQQPPAEIVRAVMA